MTEAQTDTQVQAEAPAAQVPAAPQDQKEIHVRADAPARPADQPSSQPSPTRHPDSDVHTWATLPGWPFAASASIAYLFMYYLQHTIGFPIGPEEYLVPLVCGMFCGAMYFIAALAIRRRTHPTASNVAPRAEETSQRLSQLSNVILASVAGVIAASGFLFYVAQDISTPDWNLDESPELRALAEAIESTKEQNARDISIARQKILDCRQLLEKPSLEEGEIDKLHRTTLQCLDEAAAEAKTSAPQNIDVLQAELQHIPHIVTVESNFYQWSPIVTRIAAAGLAVLLVQILFSAYKYLLRMSFHFRKVSDLIMLVSSEHHHIDTNTLLAILEPQNIGFSDIKGISPKDVATLAQAVIDKK